MADNDQMWTTLNDIRERVVAMESTLRQYMSQVSERCQVRARQLEDVERRVGAMEKKLWCMIGAASVISSIGTCALSVLLRHLG